MQRDPRDPALKETQPHSRAPSPGSANSSKKSTKRDKNLEEKKKTPKNQVRIAAKDRNTTHIKHGSPTVPLHSPVPSIGNAPLGRGDHTNRRFKLPATRFAPTMPNFYINSEFKFKSKNAFCQCSSWNPAKVPDRFELLSTYVIAELRLSGAALRFSK